jgi:hypothetical protein
MANKKLHALLENKFDVIRCTWFDAGGSRMNRLLLAAVVAAAFSMMTVPAGAQINPGPTKVPLGEPEPTYTVEVDGFRAVDESGADWTGSDEVFGRFRASRGYPVVTRTYGDVDNGESRRIGSLERCLTPQHVLSGRPIIGSLFGGYSTWNCRPGGIPGTIALSLALLEKDTGFFTGGTLGYELIGREYVSYSRSELARRLPRKGNLLVDRFTLGGPCGYQPPSEPLCSKGPFSSSGPEYEVTIIIRRVNDPPVHALAARVAPWRRLSAHALA